MTQKYERVAKIVSKKQGCGSGLDPDSVTLWISIGNPDPGARKLRNFSVKNAIFSYFLKKCLPLKRYKIAINNC
jgi:hypothetical protein